MENKKFVKIISNHCISLVTYRKSGKEIATPVWVIPYNNGGIIRTSSNSGKVKRIKNNSKCTIAPCTMTGKVTGNKIEAKAEISETLGVNNKSLKEINKKIREKYKLLDLIIGPNSLIFRILGRKNTSKVAIIKIVPLEN